MLRRRLLVLFALLSVAALAINREWAAPIEQPMNPKSGPAKVSFNKQVRPMLQANCYGCHQPALAKGDLPDDLAGRAA